MVILRGAASSRVGGEVGERSGFRAAVLQTREEEAEDLLIAKQGATEEQRRGRVIWSRPFA